MMTSTTSTDLIDHDADVVAQSLTGNRDAFGLPGEDAVGRLGGGKE